MRTPATVALFLSFALTGCALTNTATPSPEATVTGAAIQGVVHGGQQPVANAHVYLFAAGTSGYGGNGIAASTANASVSVFTAAETGQSDSVGPYILTTSKGNFSFPTYTCTPGTQLYVYVLGGNPGAGTNSALGLMAALGACPSVGNLNTTVPYISINEISTIAAAYALAGFATDATHIGSSGTALAQTGIANAFLNATNLANIQTGAALSKTPAGNGTVPQGEIEALADILAYCVNSDDSITGATSTISTNCSTLFGYALSAGTTGSAPTDTASAAINIAHNPGSNLTNLFNLATAKSPYPYGTYSPSTDFTIGIQYAGLGDGEQPVAVAIDAYGEAWVTYVTFHDLNDSVEQFLPLGAKLASYTGGGINTPNFLAIDKTGNVWLVNANATALTEIPCSAGTCSSAVAWSGGGLNHPLNLTLDGSGDIWLTNGTNTSVVEFSNAGIANAKSPFSGASGYGIAADGTGNIWVASTFTNALRELSNNGAVISGSNGFTGGGIESPYGVAIDSAGNIWVPDPDAKLSKFSNSGAPLSGSGYTGGGLRIPQFPVLDGAGNVWVACGNSSWAVSEFSNGGVPITPSSGYTPASGYYAYILAVDGSGDLWVPGYNNNGPVTEVIGVAAPVITPIAAGLPSTPTTDGSSNLATRP